MPTVTLVEWDGDRVYVGGFNINVRGGGETASVEGPGYNTEAERKAALASMRAKGRRLAKGLGVELKEKLFAAD